MRKSLRDINLMVVHGKHYKGLPDEYREFEVYLRDSGYGVLCIPLSLYKNLDENDDLDDCEVAIPIGYFMEHINEVEKIRNYLILDVTYDGNIGIDVDEQYYVY